MIAIVFAIYTARMFEPFHVSEACVAHPIANDILPNSYWKGVTLILMIYGSFEGMFNHGYFLLRQRGKHAGIVQLMRAAFAKAIASPKERGGAAGHIELQEVSEGAARSHCPHCGARLPQPGAHFCTSCGKAVDPPPSQKMDRA